MAISVIVFFFAWLLLRILTRQIERAPKLENVRGIAKSLKRHLNLLLFLALLATMIGITSVNLYLAYGGLGIYQETSVRLAAIPPGFWKAVGFGLVKVAALAVAAWIVILVARRILVALRARTKAWEQIKANDESIDAFFRSLEFILKIGVWLGVLALATRWLLLPPAVPDAIWVALRVYLVIAFGLLAVRAIAAIVDSLDALSAKLARGDRLLGLYERMRVLVPLFRRCLEYAVYVFVATLVLLQMNFIAKFAEYGPRLIEVIGIFFLARVAIEISNLLIDRKFSASTGLSELEQQQRATLVPLIKSFLRGLVYFAALVLMLGALELNPLPLLAGAGILGVVVGLGAQPVISDLVSGFFILSENHCLVGDFIEIGEARGKVESIQLRTTRIRDTNGQQHILRTDRSTVSSTIRRPTRLRWWRLASCLIPTSTMSMKSSGKPGSGSPRKIRMSPPRPRSRDSINLVRRSCLFARPPASNRGPICRSPGPFER